jgi:hypothetical protein
VTAAKCAGLLQSRAGALPTSCNISAWPTCTAQRHKGQHRMPSRTAEHGAAWQDLGACTQAP